MPLSTQVYYECKYKWIVGKTEKSWGSLGFVVSVFLIWIAINLFLLLIANLVMESIETAEVMIKGKVTGKYIAMSAKGELYTTVSDNFNVCF